MRSVITSKYQTTIPKGVRERLKLSVHDAVEWRIDGNVVVVSLAEHKFFSCQGCVHVGPGEIADDIDQSRKVRSERKK
jgi:bifunctional DNA-binding transcriptional regulator/antitoxin component of YhaV-PrlF toxin-antitoxin module